jgi:ABC-2 type transport system ATP-binding protein
MDEPTNGLDIPSKSQFRQVVSSCMDDHRTIIISTHQVADVQNLIDHITIIDGKKCVFDQSVIDIEKNLIFSASTSENVIYSQDNFGGKLSVIKRLDDDSETPLNIELLFNAVLAEREKISDVFKK